MTMPYSRRMGRLGVMTLALITMLVVGLAHRPHGHSATTPTIKLASSSTAGAFDTASGPPIA